ncbi:WYL domain-containing protein [Rhizobium sp. KDH_Rht_773_N]
MVDGRELSFRYTNWRGETAHRTVVPVEIWFGKTEWHPKEQWFLKARDVEKGEIRDFAFLDIVFDQASSGGD